MVLGRLLILHECDATGPFEFSRHSAMCSPCSCVLDPDSEKALAFSFEEERLGACPSFLLRFLINVSRVAVAAKRLILRRRADSKIKKKMEKMQIGNRFAVKLSEKNEKDRKYCGWRRENNAKRTIEKN